MRIRPLFLAALLVAACDELGPPEGDGPPVDTVTQATCSVGTIHALGVVDCRSGGSVLSGFGISSYSWVGPYCEFDTADDTPYGEVDVFAQAVNEAPYNRCARVDNVDANTWRVGPNNCASSNSTGKFQVMAIRHTCPSP